MIKINCSKNHGAKCFGCAADGFRKERRTCGGMEKRMNVRERLKDKRRIVIKIGSSSLVHKRTGMLNLHKVEALIRVLCDLRGEEKDVILVSSGAIAVGANAMGLSQKPATTSQKQALAAIGQARLMMTYQRLFAEYNQMTAQVLMTKYTVLNDKSRKNAQNTFEELLKMGVIPVVNENDTVATDEIEKVGTFGDNDHLSAIVAALVGADLLILLSDIDGMYTDDPSRNPEAHFIPLVREITDEYLKMGKETSGSSVGTGGMAAKVDAARIATDSGADLVIGNGEQVENILSIMEGKEVGTLFLSQKKETFRLMDYIEH